MTARAPVTMLPTLTGMRGIAALAVLFYHIRDAMSGFASEGVISLLAHGYLAVDLFFVLSGFVLWWNYRDQFRDRGLRAASGFMVKRFARIFPLHIAILTAMLLFAAALLASGRDPNPAYPFAVLPAHYLLIQNWGLDPSLSWNVPAWSISTEWAAYLLLAVTGGWLARLRVGPWSFPLLVVAMAALLGAWFDMQGLASIGDDIPKTGLIRCLVEFGLGVILCQWWSARREQPRGTLVITGTAIGLTIVAALLFATGQAQPAAIPIIMVVIVIFALQASVAARPLLSGKVAQWLGDISYAVYLSHYFLWVLFKLFFVDDLANVHPAAILGFVLLTLAVSHLLYRWLEVPGRRIAQRGGEHVLSAATARLFARGERA